MQLNPLSTTYVVTNTEAAKMEWNQEFTNSNKLKFHGFFHGKEKMPINRHFRKTIWSGIRDSNPHGRPLDSKSSASTSSANPGLPFYLIINN